MSKRLEFIHAVLARPAGISFLDLCRQAGIAEKTGYRWLNRFKVGGPAALADRSHAPTVPAHQVPRPLVDAIVALREAEPNWGARKLREVLRREQPKVAWPAASTITTLLKRAGLVLPRRRRAAERSLWAQGLTIPQTANDVWTADYKGEFRLGGGPYCYPLTIVDLHSRYLLQIRALESTGSESTAAQFRACFERFGLPRVIRTDNGVPFGAPCALGGLSALAVWWVRLGIRPERIAKGEPQQNGAHERMHRTLKDETARPPGATFEAQQQRFDRWLATFNTRRPHEALGNTPPADHYAPSPRALPRRLPALEYPGHVDVRRVDPKGVIRWRGQPVFLSTVLRGEYLSVEETGDGIWRIALGSLALGSYSAHTLAFTETLVWLDLPRL